MKRVASMIVKFHARGRGGGSGPVDYLLGEERNREGASVLAGKPEEVRELIDASRYAKKYTSGVLSFAEKDLPAGQREKVIESFERVLMPGLDKDQYSVLWVEHQDKGRLELNFVIPNTELLTGKRLQPYYDRADRPRIDAWQTIVNASLGLHDPNAPENRRVLVTPGNLPREKQEASQSITDSLLRLCGAGEIKTRSDVVQALSDAGFDVVRTTKSSISIADPDGGRNIRLRGAIYEQSFEAGEGLRAEIARAGERYRANAEARVHRAREVCERGTELKRADNQRRHSRAYGGDERGAPVAQAERAAHGVAYVADHLDGVSAAALQPGRGAMVSGSADRHEPGDNPETGADAGHALGEEQRGTAGVVRPQQTALREGERECGEIRREFGLDNTGGEIADDGTGKTVAERIRAVTAGLLGKAGRLGERLRGIADDVWSYATGQREAERGCTQLESAGAELKRAGDSLEPLVVRHEYEVAAAERQRVSYEAAKQEREKIRELEYRGPTLG